MPFAQSRSDTTKFCRPWLAGEPAPGTLSNYRLVSRIFKREACRYRMSSCSEYRLRFRWWTKVWSHRGRRLLDLHFPWKRCDLIWNRWSVQPCRQSLRWETMELPGFANGCGLLPSLDCRSNRRRGLLSQNGRFPTRPKRVTASCRVANRMDNARQNVSCCPGISTWQCKICDRRDVLVVSKRRCLVRALFAAGLSVAVGKATKQARGSPVFD